MKKTSILNKEAMVTTRLYRKALAKYCIPSSPISL